MLPFHIADYPFPTLFIMAFVLSVPVSNSCATGFLRTKRCLSTRLHVTARKRWPNCAITDPSGRDPSQFGPDAELEQSEQKFSSSVDDSLLKDAQNFRKKRLKTEEEIGQTSSNISFRSVLETVLIWDFFLVLALLGWLGVALVPHFASKNDSLLDPWLALWQPFTQPVLGVLMLGTIAQGVLSYFSPKK